MREEVKFTCSLQLLDHINFLNKISERGCEKIMHEQINKVKLYGFTWKVCKCEQNNFI